MNRAERRRQEAQRGLSHQRPTATVEACLEQGRLHQQANRLTEAEAAYRQALELSPQHPETLHLLGLVTYRQQRLPESLKYLNAAVERQGASPVYWFNLGVVCQKAGRSEEAVAAYKRAIALNPRYPEAYGNLGNVLRDTGNLSEAVNAYRQALTLNPAQADVHNNLGVARKEQGQPQDAIACYRKALELKPSHAEACNNLGLALMEVGTLHDAIAAFQQALSLAPAYQTARYNLGMAWSWTGDDVKACQCLDQVARSRHDHGKAVAGDAVYRSRVKHDVEQIHYLFDRRRLDESQRPYLEALQRLHESLKTDTSSANRVAVDAHVLTEIAPSFNRILFREAPARLQEGALNPLLDSSAVEARYQATHPGVTYVDDLLNEAALDALRRFCREATIWKKDYENGYIGAFLGDGFASPLLFQVADELRTKFPSIFKHHRLTQAWAFKHDSARRGLNIHADAAAVNVNFWITEDEANLNPATGGLVVYDKEAPTNWNFREYNSDRSKPNIMKWLEEVGARPIIIPYRANRAVVFNSDLFHETDDVTFKDQYLSRRINITLLYGYRGQA
ncbi:MAG TPA: tetratricopeptide repeat protein [Nitrospira sp.]|nr:tetratricopeptide repeat protein [Nitrospira sp.]